MLTHRTNVLFEEEDFALLSMLSKQESKTIGELVRSAVKKTYKSKIKKYKKNKSLETAIKKSWLAVVNPERPLDYKALINYGRKY